MKARKVLRLFVDEDGIRVENEFDELLNLDKKTKSKKKNGNTKSR